MLCGPFYVFCLPVYRYRFILEKITAPCFVATKLLIKMATGAFILILFFIGVSGSQLTNNVLSYIENWNENAVPVKGRVLVVYHVGAATIEASLEASVNNLKLFTAAVNSHLLTSKLRAYYIFNVVGGNASWAMKENLLPTHLKNVLVLSSSSDKEYLRSHIDIVQNLGTKVMSMVQTVVFLSDHVRGPFSDRINGQWLQVITGLFEENSRLGILGSLVSCEIAPHVQTHMFSARSSILADVFQKLLASQSAASAISTSIQTPSPVLNSNQLLDITFTRIVTKLGYQVTSILNARRFNNTVFHGTCRRKRKLPTGSTTSSATLEAVAVHSNPLTWCDLDPVLAMFVPWGGVFLKVRGFYCDDMVQAILTNTIQIALAEPATNVSLPETIYGGPQYGLYREYNAEQWRDRSIAHIQEHPIVMDPPDSKVCILVRTSLMHGAAATNRLPTVSVSIDNFIHCKNDHLYWFLSFFSFVCSLFFTLPFTLSLDSVSIPFSSTTAIES
jgi:hypothetical protein